MTAPIFDDALKAFAAWPEIGALIGLDLGTKTIGVAVSDPFRSLASPLETLRRKKLGPDLAALDAMVAGRAPVGVALGLPRNMDGTEGPRAQATRAFARHLAAASPRPILLWDERLSTAAVERALIEADASRARRAEVVDRMAAAYILQGVLDRLRVAQADRGEEGDDER